MNERLGHRRRTNYDNFAAYGVFPWQWMWRVLGRVGRVVLLPALRRRSAALSV